MTLVTMAISIATLLTLLTAVSVALINRWYGEHFSAAIECSKVLGMNGDEHGHYSFTASRSNTLIGRTVGRAYIAFAKARYERLMRMHRPAAS
ncbi:hypothetical protein [Burkholderia sp. BCC1047]|uniref:hypothetical protein n=1 Tax=Burkholderia sp. BCC1047 TaxID=2676299 RepID=UPI0015891F51|nr:hypothetical protein [Burkholderia sp. BCC1047]